MIILSCIRYRMVTPQLYGSNMSIYLLIINGSKPRKDVGAVLVSFSDGLSNLDVLTLYL